VGVFYIDFVVIVNKHDENNIYIYFCLIVMGRVCILSYHLDRPKGGNSGIHHRTTGPRAKPKIFYEDSEYFSIRRGMHTDGYYNADGKNLQNYRSSPPNRS
jgi:hypothetical protein